MDLIKHFDVFKLSKLDPSQNDIAIVGMGSLGSMVALEVAKLGCPEITIFDFDKIEDHNLPNQVMYGIEDVGKLKVDVAASMLLQLAGTKIEKRQKLLSRHYYSYIFVCVDSMKARKEVWQFTKNNFSTKLFLEARVSKDTVYAYAFNPQDLEHRKAYEDTLYDDEDIILDTGTCGVTPNIGATAHMASSILTWLFIQHVMETGTTNEVVVTVNPWRLHSRHF